MQFETDDNDDRDYTGYKIIFILFKLKMFIQWDPENYGLGRRLLALYYDLKYVQQLCNGSFTNVYYFL